MRYIGEIIKDVKEGKALSFREERCMAITYLQGKHDAIKRCEDCKWWKDSDGIYRRGSDAESQCPINRKEVFEGNGYYYMFESQENDK